MAAALTIGFVPTSEMYGASDSPPARATPHAAEDEALPASVLAGVECVERVLANSEKGQGPAAAREAKRHVALGRDARADLERVQSSALLVERLAEAAEAMERAKPNGGELPRAANALLRAYWVAARTLRGPRQPEIELMSASLRSVKFGVEASDWLAARAGLSEMQQAWRVYRTLPAAASAEKRLTAFEYRYAAVDRSVRRRDPALFAQALPALRAALRELPR